MTVYIGGQIQGGGGGSLNLPSDTIELVSAPGGDIDFISSDGSVTITGDNVGDTVDFVVGAIGGKYISTVGSAHTTASVGASSSVNENIAGFGSAANFVLRMRVTPSAAVSSYDVRLFRDDTFTGSAFYLAEDITLGVTTFEDSTFGVPDDDGSGEFHVRITNNDGVLSATFDIEFEVMTAVS